MPANGECPGLASATSAIQAAALLPCLSIVIIIVLRRRSMLSTHEPRCTSVPVPCHSLPIARLCVLCMTPAVEANGLIEYPSIIAFFPERRRRLAVALWKVVFAFASLALFLD